MVVLKIKDENLRDLEKIREIVCMEEGERISLDRVLAKVLAFYRRSVPYN